MIIRCHATPCMIVAYYIEMTHRRPPTPEGVIIHNSSCKHTPTLLSPRMSIDSTHKLPNIIWRYPSTLVNEMDAWEVDLLKRCASAFFITSQSGHVWNTKYFRCVFLVKLNWLLWIFLQILWNFCVPSRHLTWYTIMHVLYLYYNLLSNKETYEYVRTHV